MQQSITEIYFLYTAYEFVRRPGSMLASDLQQSIWLQFDDIFLFKMTAWRRMLRLKSY
jgi:hypothetical protein